MWMLPCRRSQSEMNVNLNSNQWPMRIVAPASQHIEKAYAEMNIGEYRIE